MLTEVSALDKSSSSPSSSIQASKEILVESETAFEEILSKDTTALPVSESNWDEESVPIFVLSLKKWNSIGKF